MKKIIRSTVAAFAALFAGAPAEAAIVVLGDNPDAPPSTNLVKSVTAGETFTLYIWAHSTGGQPTSFINGLSVRLVEQALSGAPDLDAQTAAIVLPAPSARWSNSSNVGTLDPDANTLVTEMRSSSLSEPADPIRGDFRLFGSVTVTAGQFAGVEELYLTYGTQKFGESPSVTSHSFGFGDAALASTAAAGTRSALAEGTITISAVPEPASISLAALAAAGLLGRRSRRRA